MATTPEAVVGALDGVAFPAERDALIEGAQRNNADQATLSALRGAPAVSYGSVDDVLASVEIDHDDPETAEQLRAPRRRNHTHSGLSEAEKDIGAVNPIAEELGTNRKK